MLHGEQLYSRRPAANSRNIGVDVSGYFFEISSTRGNFFWISAPRQEDVAVDRLVLVAGRHQHPVDAELGQQRAQLLDLVDSVSLKTVVLVITW